MTIATVSPEASSASHPTELSIAFVTMGCAKNEVDTDHMKKRVSAAGFSLVDDVEQADAIIINTCSFIQAATEESLDAIFEAADLPRVSSGDAKIIVAGCMPARYGDELADELDEAVAFVPCSQEDDIVAVIEKTFGVARATTTDGMLAPAAGVSAYLKISDGCDRFCSYCTIPYIRGRYHSFAFDDIVSEAQELIDAGARELVIIAQDTGRWGADFDEPSSLANLVSGLSERFPDIWLRVMYLQPEGITDEYLAVVAHCENVCNYFDIPLQHVDADILKAMNRSGSRAEFDSLIARIKQTVPDATLRTTLIAGFPGETEEQFEELCDYVENCAFDYVGVFPYSQEEQTRAAELPGQIDEDEKIERAQRIRDIADAVCTARINERVGKKMDVLIEGTEEDGQLFGRAHCQAPEVDGVTYVENGFVGEIVSVIIGDTLAYEMEGA